MALQNKLQNYLLIYCPNEYIVVDSLLMFIFHIFYSIILVTYKVDDEPGRQIFTDQICDIIFNVRRSEDTMGLVKTADIRDPMDP